MTLGFVQLFVTGAFQTVVPFVYLGHLAQGDAVVAEGLKQLEAMGNVVDPAQLTPSELEARAEILAPLFEKVPWAAMGFVASLLIYPFLGRMAGAHLARPEAAGVLIALSILVQQNPATIPMALQQTGLGKVALPTWVMVTMVLFQFAALAAGIVSSPKFHEKSKQV